MSLHPLRYPRLFFLLSAIGSVWLQGMYRGAAGPAKLRSPWLLFLLVVFFYSLSTGGIGSGDTRPARYLPLSLLREWNFDLDECLFLASDEAAVLGSRQPSAAVHESAGVRSVQRWQLARAA